MKRADSALSLRALRSAATCTLRLAISTAACGHAPADQFACGYDFARLLGKGDKNIQGPAADRYGLSIIRGSRLPSKSTNGTNRMLSLRYLRIS